MSNTQVTIDDLRTNLSDIVGRVMYGNNRVVIKKYNREAAILISIDDFEKLTDPTTRFSPEEWVAKFKVFDNLKKKNAQKSSSQIEKDVAMAVKEARARENEK